MPRRYRTFTPDMEKAAENFTRQLQGLPQNPQEPGWHAAIAGVHWKLALPLQWLGKRVEAREHFLLTSSHVLQAIEMAIPTMELPYAPLGSIDSAEIGALAASLLGDEALALKLHQYCEQFATGLIPGQPGPTPNQWIVLSDWAWQHLGRAYSLVRLRHFAGFEGIIVPDNWRRLGDTAPVWQETDLPGLLRTAAVCHKQAKASGESVPAEYQYLIPVLRTLTDAVESAAERQAAQKALAKYFDQIRNPAAFYYIYPRVLDLQAAFPEIYEPLAV